VSTRRLRWWLLAPAQTGAVLLLLAPIVWLYVASFRTNLDIESGALIPATFTVDNFGRLFAQPIMLSALRNSFLVATSSALVTTTIALLAAFAVTHFRFRGASSISSILVLAQVLPTIILIVPLVVIFRIVGLQDSIVGLAVAHLELGLPVSFWLLRGFISAVPREIEEAATIDGSSRVGLLRHVILPLAWPGIIAVGSFAFILSWGEYLVALSLITSQDSKTLPLAMTTLFQLHGIDIGMVAAAGVLISLPVAVLFMFIQRQLVAGLAAGAVQG
jgi:ABC-type glycerol-3-phosphate transport system permease component